MSVLNRAPSSRFLLSLMFPVLIAPTSMLAAEPEPLFPDDINVNVPHVSSDPSVRYDYDIVYVRARRAGDQVHKRFYTDFSQPVTMEPGADLMLLHPDGSEQRGEVLTVKDRELAMETLGLSLSEGKALLAGVQGLIVLALAIGMLRPACVRTETRRQTAEIVFGIDRTPFPQQLKTSLKCDVLTPHAARDPSRCTTH